MYMCECVCIRKKKRTCLVVICLSLGGVNFGGDALITFAKSPFTIAGGGLIGPFAILGIGGGGGGGGACATAALCCFGGDVCFGTGGGGGKSWTGSGVPC